MPCLSWVQFETHVNVSPDNPKSNNHVAAVAEVGHILNGCTRVIVPFEGVMVILAVVEAEPFRLNEPGDMEHVDCAGALLQMEPWKNPVHCP